MLQIGDRFGQGLACKVVGEGLGTFGGITKAPLGLWLRQAAALPESSGSGCGSIPVRHSWRLGPAHNQQPTGLLIAPACGSAVLFESLRVLNKKENSVSADTEFCFYGPGGFEPLDLSDANRTLSHADLKEAPKGQNISFEKWQKT